MGSNKSTEFYSLGDVNLVIGPCGGVPPIDLSGYGEGGSIEFSPNSNIHEVTVGVDGAVAISQNLDEVVMCTLTVLETTTAYRRLGRMAQAQHKQKDINNPFLMIDPNTGDEVEEENAVFQTLPDITKEQTASDRSVEIILPHARPDMLFGSALG